EILFQFMKNDTLEKNGETTCQRMFLKISRER
ncbi:MAG: hypothetical protein K0Q85_1219, partial [Caproiciproducens sp.]|nr:hypothetical protein [Caproiciproducens sp.]